MIEWHELSDTVRRYVATSGLCFRAELLPDGRVRLEVEGVHTPVWFRDSLAEAAAVIRAHEHDHAELKPGSDCWPFLRVDGNGEQPTGARRSRPAEASRCRACGSTADLVHVKPWRFSIDWWIDPTGYWRCSDCDEIAAGDP